MNSFIALSMGIGLLFSFWLPFQFYEESNDFNGYMLIIGLISAYVTLRYLFWPILNDKFKELFLPPESSQKDTWFQVVLPIMLGLLTSAYTILIDITWKAL